MSDLESDDLRVEGVEPITPHNKALYEAGKKMLVDSIEVGREFCRFMITTSLSAIPVYIALVGLVVPKSQADGLAHPVSLLVSPFLFLVAVLLFTVGYFPGRADFSLDLPANIEALRRTAVARRRCYAILGFVAFLLGVVVGCWTLVGLLAR